jgi:hypothetical protein
MDVVVRVLWFGGGARVIDMIARASVLGAPACNRAHAMPVEGSHTIEDMSQESHHIRLRIDQLERLLMFDYEPGTEDALFDICDSQGRIVKTGEVNGPVTRVRITDLDGEEYFLMVLDGEVSTVKPFQLRRVA